MSFTFPAPADASPVDVTARDRTGHSAFSRLLSKRDTACSEDCRKQFSKLMEELKRSDNYAHLRASFPIEEYPSSTINGIHTYLTMALRSEAYDIAEQLLPYSDVNFKSSVGTALEICSFKMTVAPCAEMAKKICQNPILAVKAELLEAIKLGAGTIAIWLLDRLKSVLTPEQATVYLRAIAVESITSKADPAMAELTTALIHLGADVNDKITKVTGYGSERGYVMGDVTEPLLVILLKQGHIAAFNSVLTSPDVNVNAKVRHIDPYHNDETVIDVAIDFAIQQAMDTYTPFSLKQLHLLLLKNVSVHTLEAAIVRFNARQKNSDRRPYYRDPGEFNSGANMQKMTTDITQLLTMALNFAKERERICRAVLPITVADDKRLKSDKGPSALPATAVVADDDKRLRDEALTDAFILYRAMRFNRSDQLVTIMCDPKRVSALGSDVIAAVYHWLFERQCLARYTPYEARGARGEIPSLEINSSDPPLEASPVEVKRTAPPLTAENMLLNTLFNVAAYDALVTPPLECTKILLHVAAENGDTACMRQLLQHAPYTQLMAKDKTGKNGKEKLGPLFKEYFGAFEEKADLLDSVFHINKLAKDNQSFDKQIYIHQGLLAAATPAEFKQVLASGLAAMTGWRGGDAIYAAILRNLTTAMAKSDNHFDWQSDHQKFIAMRGHVALSHTVREALERPPVKTPASCAIGSGRARAASFGNSAAPAPAAPSMPSADSISRAPVVGAGAIN